jgi:predicted RNA binding protein YcfA (HicA-like mRNA interferase family)
MPKLPQFSGRDVVKILQQFGWVIARQRGSHIILVKDGHNATLSVPDHKAVAQGTLRGLIRSAGLSVEEFVEVSRQI